MKARLAGLGLYLWVAATVSACSSPPVPLSSRSVASLSASQVVSDYYTYVGRHDVRDAVLLLAPDLASDARSSIGNMRGLSGIVVTAPADIRVNNKYQDEVQVVARYTARYRRVITQESGPQTRFVYCGRNAPGQAWKIIAIGTGP